MTHIDQSHCSMTMTQLARHLQFARTRLALFSVQIAKQVCMYSLMVVYVADLLSLTLDGRFSWISLAQLPVLPPALTGKSYQDTVITSISQTWITQRRFFKVYIQANPRSWDSTSKVHPMTRKKLLWSNCHRHRWFISYM